MNRNEPEEAFQRALHERPKDEEAEGWQALLVSSCIETVTRSCEDIISNDGVSRKSRENELSTPNDEYPSSALNAGGNSRTKNGLVTLIGRKRSDSEISDRENGVRKRRRLDLPPMTSLDYEPLLSWVDEAVAALDKVLIIAGDFDQRDGFLDILQRIEVWITNQHARLITSSGYRQRLPTSDCKFSSSLHGSRHSSFSTFPSVSLLLDRIVLAATIPRMSCHDPKARGSMASYRYPLILTGNMTAWPAMTKWKSPEYWFKATIGGRRIVPVEIGHKYTDEDWCMEMMAFGKFLQDYMLRRDEQSGGIGYLAQHDIFSQIPALQADIQIPDECYIPTGKDYTVPSSIGEPSLVDLSTSEVQKNIWMGPTGTVSPLHYDPYHNILCQVTGKKYIRLYAPQETPKLYPHAVGLMHNTSKVDVEAAGDTLKREYPLFSEAKYLEVYLCAGEMLWLPKEWWHYVRSVETGISVSFWWR